LAKDPTPTTQDALPFGAIQEPSEAGKKPRRPRRKKPASDKAKAEKAPVDSAPKERAPKEPASDERAPRAKAAREKASGEEAPREAAPADGEGGDDRRDWRKDGARRGGSRRGGRRRRGRGGQGGQNQNRNQNQNQNQGGQEAGGEGVATESGEGRSRNRRGGQRQGQAREPREPKGEVTVASGMFVLDKGGVGVLRRIENQWIKSKDDIYVPKNMIQREKLREGSIVEGRIGRGQKHKYQLIDVQTVDGKDPRELKDTPVFKNLTSIDPDFHYAVGDGLDNVSMRVVDTLCPIGRGQRGLIVAPPRSGKTTLMREFAAGIEKIYTDVNLFVLLVDERPEEATEWRRSVTTGQVFVSTADETSKNHILLAEAVWARCMRLVELGEDVVLLLDSITRLARAYNNQSGGSGRTMSGGLDSRAMERPRKIFGSARNTETAGSLTIIGTALIETGSRMDQLVFEEFKGTGNLELVLSRKLADRRIFPAIDVERTGTRKEEKLLGTKRLQRINTLRRVLSRMNFIEAMELLITKLDDVDKTDDFLARFEVDPEA